MKDANFPGDPRFSGWISPSSEDTSALSRNAWLSTLLLDCILQRSIPPQDANSVHACHNGSLGFHAYMQACNDLIRDDPDVVEDARTKGRKIAHIRNIARIRKQMKACFGSRTISRLLIPIVLGDHFLVLCLDCSFSTSEFFANLTLYDSLIRRTRQINHNVASIVKDINFFVHSFILHDKQHKHLRDTDEALIQRVQYGDCPIQENGFDCGLFAVGIILHVIEGKRINTETFKQQHVTNLRSRLATVFAGDSTELGTTSQVVRECFPQLRGSSILDSFGLEVVSREPKTERRLSSDSAVSDAVMVLTSYAEAHKDAGDGNDNEDDEDNDDDKNEEDDDEDDNDEDNDDEYFDCDISGEGGEESESNGEGKHDGVADSALPLESGKTTKEGSSEPGKPASKFDNKLYEILKDAKVDCFSTLDEVMPFIEKYEIRSGYRLRVQRSVSDRFK